MKRNKSSHEVTIKDVAKEAGVSYSTVSRVVNNKSYVNPDTRERVLQAMVRLGYQVNLHARSLAGGQSNVIGLLVVDLTTQYMGEIINGIDDVLAAHQYELMLYTTHRRKAKESAYVHMMARGLADGLLISLPREPEAYLKSLRQKGFPYVIIDHRTEEPSDRFVSADNHQGGYEATKHLIELGHRRIGIVTGWTDMVSAQDRLAGYQAALAEAGILFSEELLYEGDFSQPGGFRGGSYLLDLAEPPTAVFASNDISAMGVIEAIRAQGLQVPHDISVVGFDDIPTAALLNPQLTTMRQPLQEMGRSATQMLLDMLKNPETMPESIIFPTELIVRESTAPPQPSG
ncbi:MAG: LacI family transcriptional regulator [Anaerolineaceae bacterium]|nr:LacI family transcriptional regulator [Anaerolineaceae bacterium]